MQGYSHILFQCFLKISRFFYFYHEITFEYYYEIYGRKTSVGNLYKPWNQSDGMCVSFPIPTTVQTFSFWEGNCALQLDVYVLGWYIYWWYIYFCYIVLFIFNIKHDHALIHFYSPFNSRIRIENANEIVNDTIFCGR